MDKTIRWQGEEKSATFVDAAAKEAPAGDRLMVRVEALGATRLRLQVGDRWINVQAVRTQDGVWVWHEGRARLVKPEAQEAGRRGKREAGPAAVTPPMPATVLRVLVERGQRVEARAPLVVVTAMKMEMTLHAPHAGVVVEIRTKVGAAVRPGDILVEVRPE